VHEHPLDFTDAWLQFTNRSAANCFTVGVCEEKHKPMISYVCWAKAVKSDAGIPTAQVIIERPDEANSICRVRLSRDDLDS
jgi:hypothetical protein